MERDDDLKIKVRDNVYRTITVPITGGRLVFIEHPCVFSAEDLAICKRILAVVEKVMVWDGHSSDVTAPAAKES